jgi:hypothetical protein
MAYGLQGEFLILTTWYNLNICNLITKSNKSTIFEEENIYHANTNTIWAKYEFVINFETNTIIFLTSSNNSDKTNIMP